MPATHPLEVNCPQPAHGVACDLRSLTTGIARAHGGKAMRITGLILALVGLMGVAICVFQMVNGDASNSNVTAPPSNAGDRPSAIVPLVISAIAVFAGGLMFLFGGRGWFVANDPRVRN
jgi:hypothetical protein